MSPKTPRTEPAPTSRPAHTAKAAAARRTRRVPRDPQDLGTRQKVVEAAIQCILEQGFYRSSSNAIAEAAGLSWGVIQYYFGSRESLMLAVVEEGNRRLLECLSRANITGQTMPERLDQYFDTLKSYYGEPEYLAFIQALLNLSHDPRTSAQTLESMTTATRAIEIEIGRLTKQLFAGTGVRRTALTTFPFNVLRGMALGEEMLRTLPYDTQALSSRFADQRRLLTRAVTLLLESEGVTISGSESSPASA
jgi:AcrR family transcriptional regulator